MLRIHHRLIAAALLVLTATPSWSAITVENWGRVMDQTSGNSPSVSVSYSPNSAPDAVIVWCVSYNDYYSSGEAWTGATYGGVSMTAVATAEDTANEPGEVRAFILTTPATGTQTAACTHNGSWKSTIGSGKAAVLYVISLTTDSGNGLELGGSCTVGENVANPSCDLTSQIRTYRALAAFYSGVSTDSNITAGTGLTLNSGAGNNTCNIPAACDGGTRVSVTSYSSSDQTGSSETMNFTVTSDDVALVAVSVREGAAGGASTRRFNSN